MLVEKYQIGTFDVEDGGWRIVLTFSGEGGSVSLGFAPEDACKIGEVLIKRAKDIQIMLDKSIGDPVGSIEGGNYSCDPDRAS